MREGRVLLGKEGSDEVHGGEHHPAGWDRAEEAGEEAAEKPASCRGRVDLSRSARPRVKLCSFISLHGCLGMKEE